MTDLGGGNTSIFYTLNGSTPVPANVGDGSTIFYTGTAFTVASGTTVKAVGFWGESPQPYSYTAPYGYVASAVVTTVAP
jgi:hypothetical protein